MKRRECLTLFSTGCVVASSGCLEAAGSRSPLLHGFYPGRKAASPATFRPFEKWLGRVPTVLTLYVNANLSEDSIRDYLDTQLTPVWQTGHVPVITWLPYLGTPEQTPADIERRIHTGQYDDIIDRWISALTEWVLDGDGEDRRLYFRPLPEMNGNWLPWSAVGTETTPADYRSAWQYLYNRFREAGLTATHVQWMWNPNFREVGGVATEEYYPGDEFVDWVGIDGYNFGSTQDWSEWMSPDEVFAPMLSRVRTLTQKPVAFPEFGSTSFKEGTPRPAAKSQWITDVYEFMRREDVKMACWFNVDKETDWAVFDGTRGTDTYETDDRQYNVYDSYKRAVTRDVLSNGERPERLLTDDQFAGNF
ncbi:glycoside hydrolase family 26 protein [Halogranum rubrum]|nr:glycosyl hydrolase [Halogranum rubrum]